MEALVQNVGLPGELDASEPNHDRGADENNDQKPQRPRPHHYHDPIRARWPTHGASIALRGVPPASEPRRTTAVLGVPRQGGEAKLFPLRLRNDSVNARN